jgi:hypothetical protein
VGALWVLEVSSSQVPGELDLVLRPAGCHDSPGLALRWPALRSLPSEFYVPVQLVRSCPHFVCERFY